MSVSQVNSVVQIGIVVHNADAAIKQYAELLGITGWKINFVDTDRGKGRKFRAGDKNVAVKAKIAWAMIGGIELELIEPQDTTSIYAKHLETYGPGIHHLMFGTDHYDRTVKNLSGCGIRKILSGELQATRFQLFDTRDTLGMISEFAKGDALVPDKSVEIE